MTFLNNPNPKTLPEFKRVKSFDDPASYIISEELLDAVKVAIFLGQPLLITGEAGTSKTQLASAIAHKFGLGKPEVFNTKSSSNAKDLLYIYDSLAHFQHIHTHKEKLSEDEIEKLFINFQALGKAILSDNGRKVVLIDEIDKAPRDLPNNILDVIEKMWFEVPEIKRTGNDKIVGSEKNRPIVILTSNSEKNLPDAFLRRCIFFHISFPNEQTLINILKNKLLDSNYKDEQWKYLIDHFMQIRAKVNRKKPATAELIYWATILQNKGFDFNKLKPDTQLSEEDQKTLNLSYYIIVKNVDDLKVLKEK